MGEQAEARQINAAELTIVIPAYNEADSLPQVLPELLQLCEQNNFQLILVNDGSKDKTREVLQTFESQPCLKVLHHKLNRGYGGALKTGLSCVETPYAVTIDADGQHYFEDIFRLLHEMKQQDADLVIGSRKGHNPSGWFRELGKSIIRTTARIMMPVPIYDLNSGFKLYRTDLVKNYLQLCPDTMAFSDVITLIFVSQRHLVLEIPIQVRTRIAGKSTISIRTAVDTLFEILNITLLFKPLNIFLPISILAVLFGLGWGIPIMAAGRGVSVGSMLAIVTGLIFFFLGLVAEQLASIRREISLTKARLESDQAKQKE